MTADRLSVTRDQALQAAWDLAHGLELDDNLEVLSDRGNLVVQFGDDDVVARMPHLTAFSRANPIAWMQREVDVVKQLTLIGAPVLPPVAGVPYGPHVVNGVPITLWEYNPRLDFQPDTMMVSWSYYQLHLKLLELYMPELPWLTPFSQQIPEGLDALGSVNAVEARVLHTLHEEYERLVDEMIPAEQPSLLIHGDAHPGNLIRSHRGPVWLDFEETCNGPLEWDLACLWRTKRMDGAELVKSFMDDVQMTMDYPDVSEEQLTPYLKARDLEAVVWLLCLAYQQPGRYEQTSTGTLNAFMASRES